MDGYMEDCKEYLQAWEQAHDSIELLQIAINHKEIINLVEKKDALKDSIKASTDKKSEYAEILRKAEIEHWNMAG